MRLKKLAMAAGVLLALAAVARGPDLRGPDLRGSDLYGPDLRGSDLREVGLGEFASDEVAVLDAVGATGDQVKAQRRAGRTPVCYVRGRGPQVTRGLQLCREKGFERYFVDRE